MKKIEHTKGPWEFRKDDCWTIFADGSSIMGDMQYYPWVPDNEADWRLIAAAPDMLEAMIDVRRALEIANFTGELAVVDAAIKKATE